MKHLPSKSNHLTYLILACKQAQAALTEMNFQKALWEEVRNNHPEAEIAYNKAKADFERLSNEMDTLYSLFRTSP